MIERDEDEERAQFDALNKIFDGTLTRKGACSFCRINVAVLNKSLRFSLFSMLVENFVSNFCYALRHEYYIDYCKIFWLHIFNGFLETLEEDMLDPEYLCPLVGLCTESSLFEYIYA